MVDIDTYRYRIGLYSPRSSKHRVRAKGQGFYLPGKGIVYIPGEGICYLLGRSIHFYILLLAVLLLYSTVLSLAMSHQFSSGITCIDCSGIISNTPLSNIPADAMSHIKLEMVVLFISISGHFLYNLKLNNFMYR